MAITGRLLNQIIPHLEDGQRVKDWRIVYSAATLTFSEDLRTGYLPLVVDRSLAEQQWAAIAAKQETLEAALDELELRLDGKKPRFIAMADFFDLTPNNDLDAAHVSEYFFATIEAGQAAGVSSDITASKFLQFAPQGCKVFEENDKLIKPGMTEGDLVTLYDAVIDKMGKKGKRLDIAKVVTQEDSIPKWAQDLKTRIQALASAISTTSSITQADVKQSDSEEVFLADREEEGERHGTPKRCKKCSGIGHKARVCTSKQKLSNNKDSKKGR